MDVRCARVIRHDDTLAISSAFVVAEESAQELPGVQVGWRFRSPETASIRAMGDRKPKSLRNAGKRRRRAVMPSLAKLNPCALTFVVCNPVEVETHDAYPNGTSVFGCDVTPSI